MIIPLFIFNLLIYISLGLSVFSIVYLIFLFTRDLKQEKLW